MNWAIPILTCLAGFLLAFHPMLFSGLSMMQADPGDMRFNHYVLEHTFRWLTQKGVEFWNPGIFFPTQNTLAFSDTLLGVAPFYWIYRFLNIAQETSFQLWIFTVSALNFAAMFIFLRRFLCSHALPASLGAFLLAFGSPRIAQINHPQLLAQFNSVFAFYALTRLFQGATERRWIWLFTASCILQIYSGFYNGWFLGFTLALALLWSLIFASSRQTVLRLLAIHWKAATIAIAVSGVILWPLVSHYLGAAAQVGYRSFWETRDQIPTPQSWFNMGKESFLYAWTHKIKLFKIIPIEHEHRIGIGIASTLIMYFGLMRLARTHPKLRVLAATLLTIVVLMTSIPHVGSLWSYLYPFIPAASAVRAVARIGVFLLFIYAIGVAFFFERLNQNGQLRKLGLLSVIFFLEQGMTTPAYNWQEVRKQSDAVGRQIPPDCKSFFYWPDKPKPDGIETHPWLTHLDAMWAQVQSGVPTVNGYSGNSPPGWKLYELDAPNIPERLEAWKKANALSDADVCVIRSR